MSRVIKKLLPVVLVLILVSTLLVSCFEDPKSAYDIAVENGFVGTEEQWLASLKGQDLNIIDIYESAVENGNYTGDLLSFLSDYLQLDSEMIAEAILKNQAKDTSHITALPLLASVSIQCSSSSLGATGGGAAGSGIFLAVEKNSGDAYVLTNYHVVMRNNAANSTAHSSISVFLYGEDTTVSNAIPAKYIGGSFTYDIAVLKISNSSRIKQSAALPVSVANSDEIVTGADAIAIGNGAGLGISVTRGIVSMDSKMVQVSATGDPQRLLQIDTPVNEGNSGGGLFNSEGKLIGIVSAKMEDDRVENIGYAIPSNIAIRSAKRIIAEHELRNGSSGFITPVSLTVAQLGIEMLGSNAHAVYDMERNVTYISETVTVNRVALNSVAKSAGLAAGDVVREVVIDGTVIRVERDFAFRDAMMLCNPDSSVTIRVERNGVEKDITFTTPESCFVVKA